MHTVGFGREQFDHDVEIVDVQTPDRALAGSRLLARVTLRQRGYDGRRARLTIRQQGRVLASEKIEFARGGQQQAESLLFHAGGAGAKRLEVAVDLMPDEENPQQQRDRRGSSTWRSRQPRVLYLEGEPRWEFKFIRRAMEKDPSVRLVSILRTTQNKIYRQGIDAPPGARRAVSRRRVDELFGYQGLIIGSVEASYFTSGQQELIRQFADRRGGGVLFLGGRSALAEGG